MTCPNQPGERHAPLWSRRPLVAVGFALLAGAMVVAGLMAYGLFGPEPALVVTPEVTVLTEPLAADGLPDFAAHALDLLGRGMPPAENAAVLLLAAAWPFGIDPADRAEVCRAIGAANRPPDDQPIDAGYGDRAMHEALERFVVGRLPDELDPSTVALDLENATQLDPWRGDDAPPLRDWLDTRGRAIDLAVEATRKPVFFMPTRELIEGDRRSLLMPMMRSLGSLRDVAQSLRLRAMRHLGEGRSAAAWQDIHAVHRLARLLSASDHATMLSNLFAIALVHVADHATLRLLDTPGLPAAEIEAIGRDLATLPPLIDRRRLIHAERLGVAAYVATLAVVPRDQRAADFEKDTLDGVPVTSLLLSTSLDWNVVARRANAYGDALDDAFQLVQWADRRLAFARLEADHAIAERWPEGPAAVARARVLANGRLTRSRAVGDGIARALYGPCAAVDLSVTRGETHGALVRVAAALAAWRAGEGRGRYPASLDDLAPALVAAVPVDPFTGRPFVYERRGDGYMLYSLGPNAADDGGTDFGTTIERGEWSDDDSVVGQADGTDFVVRLPMPSNSVIERIRAAPAAEP